MLDCASKALLLVFLKGKIVLLFVPYTNATLLSEPFFISMHVQFFRRPLRFQLLRHHQCTRA